ncbi:LacI family DNA-binding transcriptional regulator [Streptomyces sp. NBC_01022]|uniref:LacI family DNA-binding transcriptional regulator n=1 Tax=Streptomyces sp. NBC_01022 TaxID=2903723 RepID=UPI002DDA987C|nr:LacI family DNA-binding transcriptional regulator [Streptomyces sp. NBC_01022]WRZ79294.1 LacI family transcriptional regulator [Streptomyces sp. NBC_01022]WRZ86382.1 LacI family transcriptional regulator [Streptomyces sp. NBC_01022]
MSQLTDQPAEGPVPTSADVARLAGVSRATVSYVLNNNTAVRISDPTRRRVREAATELGYVPHAAARSLRAGHSRMVLLPTANLPSAPLHHRFLHGLESGLRRLDYTVVQYGSIGLDPDDAARAWAELRPVAVIAPGSVPLAPQSIAVLRRSGAKAVITLGPQPVPGAHALITDQREVGGSAVRHLLERGRRRIGVVMPGEPGLALFAGPRLAGARQAAAADGARIEELPLRYTEESAAALAARWRTLGLDAVFAYDDSYAMLLMRALQDVGIDVPAEAAVVGADDSMVGRLLRPRLSSVRMEMATVQPLADLVDRLVQNPGTEPERHDLLRARTVHRESS